MLSISKFLLDVGQALSDSILDFMQFVNCPANFVHKMANLE